MSLAAFVLIALAEARDKWCVEASDTDRVNTAMNSARLFISAGKPRDFDNMYELAIVLYTLTVVDENSGLREAILNTLEGLAKEEGANDILY